MNQLTKSELIEKLEMAKVDSRDYDNGLNRAIFLIEDTEILPDPVPEVDTELEEAKKLVGTWVKASYAGDDLFLIKKVKRDPSNWDLDLFSDTRKINIKACTPATLPTAAPKWRCMKTDVENTVTPRLVCLDVGYGSYYHVGWYDVAKKAWCVADQYIDLSCYETFEWLEIPRGE